MEQKKIWRAAIYLRTSKGIQDDRSNTLDNQELIIRDYLCNHDDVKICTIKSDDGYSGLTVDRPAYQEMIRELGANIIDCIVVEDLSRFSRSFLGATELITRVFPRAGIRLIAVNDNFDSIHANPDAFDLLIPLRTLINQAYSMDISKKIHSNLEVQWKNGAFMGAFAPYG